jgi:hypothetical protein
MQGYSKGSVGLFIHVHCNGVVDASMEGYNMGQCWALHTGLLHWLSRGLYARI